MSDDPGRRRTFTVRLAQPVFRYIDLRVRESSDARAAAAAARKAVKIHSERWHESDIDQHVGPVDVVAVVDHAWARGLADEDREAGDGSAKVTDIVEEIVGRVFGDRRYPLLTADVENGEGDLLRANWLHELGESVALADIAGDWVADLERLRDAGVRGFMHELDAVARKAGHPPLYDDNPGSEPPSEEPDAD